MPEFIIDAFEPVHIHENNRKVLPRLLLFLKHTARQLLVTEPIVHSRHGILHVQF